MPHVVPERLMQVAQALAGTRAPRCESAPARRSWDSRRRGARGAPGRRRSGRSSSLLEPDGQAWMIGARPSTSWESVLNSLQPIAEPARTGRRRDRRRRSPARGGPSRRRPRRGRVRRTDETVGADAVGRMSRSRWPPTGRSAHGDRSAPLASRSTFAECSSMPVRAHHRAAAGSGQWRQRRWPRTSSAAPASAPDRRWPWSGSRSDWLIGARAPSASRAPCAPAPARTRAPRFPRRR